MCSQHRIALPAGFPHILENLEFPDTLEILKKILEFCQLCVGTLHLFQYQIENNIALLYQQGFPPILENLEFPDTLIGHSGNILELSWIFVVNSVWEP